MVERGDAQESAPVSESEAVAQSGVTPDRGPGRWIIAILLLAAVPVGAFALVLAADDGRPDNPNYQKGLAGGRHYYQLGWSVDYCDAAADAAEEGNAPASDVDQWRFGCIEGWKRAQAGQ
jgi:hypothetical protein